MEGATGKVVEQLITLYGPPGLIIIVLMVVIWRIFSLYIGEVARNHEKALTYVEAMNKMSSAIEGLKDLVRMRSDKE